LGKENIFVPEEDSKDYPSPEELKGKYIMKGKKPPPGKASVKISY